MPHLTIRLLGAFQVGLDDLPITKFESNKVRALLAYLAVENSKAHTREKLVTLFWPDLPPKRAHANLSNSLYNLRSLLEDARLEQPFLLRSRQFVQFNPQSETWLDVDVFMKELGDHRRSDLSYLENSFQNLQKFQKSVELYRGEFLEGLTFESSLLFDEWVTVMCQRFHRRAVDGLGLLVKYYSQRDEIGKALSYAWRLVEIDPLDEASSRQLMRLLAADGQRNRALAQFERLQQSLTEELGVRPEPQTLDLRNQIRADEFSPARPAKKKDNLPTNLTSLIGRLPELSEIQERLAHTECRLLTILGPGGSGKTRLALQVAHSSLEHFSSGVCFVPLNPVQSSTSILPVIVTALELLHIKQSSLKEQLINYLRSRNLLLVLDGFEHLLQGAVSLADLLRQSPGLKILVTSRTRLGIKGEELYSLAGLSYPQPTATESEILDSDAVQLLLDGMRRWRHDFCPQNKDIYSLLHICRMVEGMPLSILLAASWVGVLSPAEIAYQVSRSMDFLTADWADAPARQRSLRATFDHSWRLLSERQQTIFQSLSVFRGSFSLSAAQSVNGTTPHELRELVDRTMLSCKTAGRYEMHELLRQYGREKLAEFPEFEREVANLHATFYLDWLAHLTEALKDARQEETLELIDRDLENFRLAWTRKARQAIVGEIGSALDPLCLYYELRLRCSDGESACQMAANHFSVHSQDMHGLLLKARLLTWQSRFARLLGKLPNADRLIDQAQSVLEKVEKCGLDPANAQAFILLELGESNIHRDRMAASRYCRQSLELYHRLGDTWGAAQALAVSAFIAHHSGYFQKAVELYTECLDLHRTLGDPRGIAYALIFLGQNKLRQGQFDDSTDYIYKGVAVLEKIGDRGGIAHSYFEMGRVYFWSGEFVKSLEMNIKATPTFEDLGMLDAHLFSLISCGLILSHCGQYGEAIQVVNRGITLAQDHDARREVGLAQVILGMAYLGQRDLEQAHDWALESVQQYRQLNQLDELSLALAIMGYTHAHMDQWQQAEQYLCEVLQIGLDTRGLYPVLYVLYLAAMLLSKRNERLRAIEIAALANGYPFVSNSYWFEEIAGRDLAALTQALPAEAVVATQEHGARLDIWMTAEDLLGDFQGQIYM